MSETMISTNQGPPLAFTGTDALRAGLEWDFSCGPASLAALLGLTPDRVRPHLGDYAGYMNTRHMGAAIRAAGWCWSGVPSPSGKYPPMLPSDFGVIRVQWGGPWLKPGVPPKAAAKFTHWIASRLWEGEMWLYDVNAKGWVGVVEWTAEIAPKIMAEVKRCDGTWRFTDVISVWKPEPR
jgi:hypothetical protein